MALAKSIIIFVCSAFTLVTTSRNTKVPQSRSYWQTESVLEIGHYSNVTTAGCGIAPLGIAPFGDQCFKWHKNNQWLSPIKNGRYAYGGELPWNIFIWRSYAEPGIVGIISNTWAECTGVLLNERWVLTAGHCIYCDGCVEKRAWVYPNYVTRGYWEDGIELVVPDAFYVYPAFQQHAEKTHDIGLIRLTQPLHLRTTGRLDRRINTICLSRQLTPDGTPYTAQTFRGQYAMANGFGYSGTNKVDRLKMGWLIIASQFYGDDLKARPAPRSNGTYVCQGDSGGPLVQYVYGRAVAVGILSGAGGNKDKCTMADTDYINYSIVSNHIDWIKDIINRFT